MFDIPLAFFNPFSSVVGLTKSPGKEYSVNEVDPMLYLEVPQRKQRTESFHGAPLKNQDRKSEKGVVETFTTLCFF